MLSPHFLTPSLVYNYLVFLWHVNSGKIDTLINDLYFACVEIFGFFDV